MTSYYRKKFRCIGCNLNKAIKPKKNCKDCKKLIEQKLKDKFS